MSTRWAGGGMGDGVQLLRLGAGRTPFPHQRRLCGCDRRWLQHSSEKAARKCPSGMQHRKLTANALTPRRGIRSNESAPLASVASRVEMPSRDYKTASRARPNQTVSLLALQLFAFLSPGLVPEDPAYTPARSFSCYGVEREPSTTTYIGVAGSRNPKSTIRSNPPCSSRASTLPTIRV
ncbi:hypothetical protein BDY21DRAFT_163971 [Lineolata rhizophorae]|uniref:Uncharacterized protein n=1 Tax=Lineolata rhizophorae TaxID=578093 RepID=A0A6A6P946_9PEZI|nr:hypothetical protein BDY21DRAFT_163971 [Lineolata rhizophorae]